MIKLNFDYFFDKQKQTAYYGYTTNGKVNKSFFIVGHQDNFEFFFGAFRKISNVHELQNLFYLITNMELPIKKLLNFDVMT